MVITELILPFVFGIEILSVSTILLLGCVISIATMAMSEVWNKIYKKEGDNR